jgi:hypothetical protein
MNNRPRERRTNKADRRAIAWVRQAEIKAVAGESAITLPSPITYTVRREILGSTPGGIFERSDIMELLASDHGAKTYHNLSLSLISPREGKKIARRWQGEPDTLRQRLEESAEALPDSLSGFLFRAIIVGVKQNQEGSRYVGCTLDRSLQTAMRREHLQVIQGLGRPSALDRSGYTPHLTLFETRDQEQAQILQGKLGKLVHGSFIPIQLCQAEVVPIANTPISPLS